MSEQVSDLLGYFDRKQAEAEPAARPRSVVMQASERAQLAFA